MATLPKTVNTKSPLWEHHATMTGHAPNHITTTTTGTDHNPLTTDTAKEDALTSHDHTTDPTMAEALASIKHTYPTPHPATKAVDATHQLTNALGKSSQDTPHWHNHNTFKTFHFSHQCYSQGYSTDQS